MSWFLEQLCFYEITKNAEKRKGCTPLSLNLARGARVVASAVCKPGPWLCSCVPVLSVQHGVFAEKKKSREKGVMTVANKPANKYQ